MRHELKTEHGCAPIKGAKFTFRTFNGTDGRFGSGPRGDRDSHRTLDQLVTITLPAIEGFERKMVPCMSVKL